MGKSPTRVQVARIEGQCFLEGDPGLLVGLLRDAREAMFVV
jgi:hypothetical protein